MRDPFRPQKSGRGTLNIMQPPALLNPPSLRQNRLAPLESIRGFAAAYVLAGHICNVYLQNPGWALPFRFASEAVVLFFLLSGFVVRYATRDDTTIWDYFSKRIRRIYPLFILSLVFSYLAACVHAGYMLSPLIPDLIGNLAMMQDFGLNRPGVWVVQYYNDALWSLAYEWWFYVFFIALLKWIASPLHRNITVCIAASAAMVIHTAWPNQFGYFITNFVIWWSAAEMARHYRCTGELPNRAVIGWCVALIVLGTCWVPALLSTPPAERFLGLYPILDIRRFFASGLFLLIGAVWYKLWPHGGNTAFQLTFGPFKVIAPISYGIYIFHFPIIHFFANSKLSNSPLMCVIAIVSTVLVVAYITEIWLQKWINTWAIWKTSEKLTQLQGAQKNARPT